MSDDIVERLDRQLNNEAQWEDVWRLVGDAAYEITRLRADNERLREALKPFSDAASTDDYVDDIEIAETDTARKITFGDLRRARAALEGATEPNIGS